MIDYFLSHIVLCLVAQLCVTLCDPMDCSLPGSSVHGNSLGKNTGVGSHALLHGIIPTQVSNTGLLHFRLILYHMSHQGSPRILEWVAYPFSRVSSQQGIKPGSPALQVDSLPAELPGKPNIYHIPTHFLGEKYSEVKLFREISL